MAAAAENIEVNKFVWIAVLTINQEQSTSILQTILKVLDIFNTYIEDIDIEINIAIIATNLLRDTQLYMQIIDKYNAIDSRKIKIYSDYHENPREHRNITKLPGIFGLDHAIINKKKTQIYALCNSNPFEENNSGNIILITSHGTPGGNIILQEDLQIDISPIELVQNLNNERINYIIVPRICFSGTFYNYIESHNLLQNNHHYIYMDKCGKLSQDFDCTIAILSVLLNIKQQLSNISPKFKNLCKDGKYNISIRTKTDYIFISKARNIFENALFFYELYKPSGQNFTEQEIGDFFMSDDEDDNTDPHSLPPQRSFSFPYFPHVVKPVQSLPLPPPVQSLPLPPQRSFSFPYFPHVVKPEEPVPKRRKIEGGNNIYYYKYLKYKNKYLLLQKLMK